ncbi:sugar-binding transcriptional regulator [Liquorilactobacillus ghanensis]|uniref:sugar-binding transcriptional regulator n=1 Tax=Liquorilactobacillus ghanensis TaxID=399370 RepID=UPI0039EB0132
MTDKKNTSKYLSQLIAVSKMYYEKNMTQQQISDIVHIHRTEISRLLKEAKKLGIVKFTINDGMQDIRTLEHFFIHKFNLKDVLIVPTNVYEQNVLESLGVLSAKYLEEQFRSNMTIGISWGKTVASAVKNISSDHQLKNSTIIPLIAGPLGKLPNDYHANTLVIKLSQKLSTNKSTLEAPAIVSSKEIMQELLNNPNNQSVINNWNKLDIAIVGIGSDLITNQSRWKAFYKGTSFINTFKVSGVVGDILSQPFDYEGNIVDCSANIISLKLSDLMNVPNTIAIAEGKLKVKSIIGALRTGIINTLITTDITAIKIKEELDKSQM